MKNSSVKPFVAVFVSVTIIVGSIVLWSFSSTGYFVSFFHAPQKVSVTATSTPSSSPSTPSVPSFQYFEVTNSCGPHYGGDTCVNMRSGPGIEYPVVSQLRNGVVLRIGETVERSGTKWYKVLFATELLYPERVKGGLFVSADVVHSFFNEGDLDAQKGDASTTKRIIVDVSKQMLYAYDGDVLFMEEAISTGLEFTPTPRGHFTVFRKTPSRYMQGPIPGVSDQVYDLPGVPWDLYFTNGGAVIHGAYWHDKFGEPWSHGCVNLPPQKAKELYQWADIGMPVTVHD